MYYDELIVEHTLKRCDRQIFLNCFFMLLFFKKRKKNTATHALYIEHLFFVRILCEEDSNVIFHAKNTKICICLKKMYFKNTPVL